MGIERKKGSRRIAVFSLCLCFALAGCGRAQEASEAPELLEPADTLQENAYAERRDVYTMRTMESVVLPYQEELSFSCSGIVESVDVYTGKIVKEGDVLAALYDTAGENCERLYKQLEAMQADNAYNNRRAEINIEIAKLSGQDTARLELELGQAKELQEFEEQHLLAQIEKAEAERGGNQLIAPFSGTVTAVSGLEEEAAAVEGSPVLVLAGEQERYLKTAYVERKVIDACHEYYALINGKKYALEYIPPTDEELEAIAVNGETIMSSFCLADAEEVTFGANAFVCIVSDYRENVIAVPKSALYKEGRDYYVYVLKEEIRVRQPVEVGVIGGVYAEITGGLEEGACIYVAK